MIWVLEDDLGTKIENKTNQAFDILTNFGKKNINRSAKSFLTTAHNYWYY